MSLSRSWISAGPWGSRSEPPKLVLPRPVSPRSWPSRIPARGDPGRTPIPAVADETAHVARPFAARGEGRAQAARHRGRVLLAPGRRWMFGFAAGPPALMRTQPQAGEPCARKTPGQSPRLRHSIPILLIRAFLADRPCAISSAASGPRCRPKVALREGGGLARARMQLRARRSARDPPALRGCAMLGERTPTPTNPVLGSRNPRPGRSRGQVGDRRGRGNKGASGGSPGLGGLSGALRLRPLAREKTGEAGNSSPTEVIGAKKKARGGGRSGAACRIAPHTARVLLPRCSAATRSGGTGRFRVLAAPEPRTAPRIAEEAAATWSDTSPENRGTAGLRHGLKGARVHDTRNHGALCATSGVRGRGKCGLWAAPGGVSRAGSYTEARRAFGRRRSADPGIMCRYAGISGSWAGRGRAKGAGARRGIWGGASALGAVLGLVSTGTGGFGV